MSTHVTTWVDGTPSAALPLPDRGLDYGDGVFETLLLVNGVAVCLNLHLERLHCGLGVLAFPDCMTVVQEQLALATQAVKESGWHWSSLRLSVTRGEGPRGYLPPQKAVPRVMVQVAALEHDAGIMSTASQLSVSRVRLSAQPLLAGIKHLNRLEQVLAAMQAQQAGVDESVMLDQHGNVVSAIAGNLFAVLNGELVTPPLTACGVAGTRRRLIMETLAPAIGIDTRETELTLPGLKSAQELFCCNSLRGMRPVAALEGTRWTSHPVCEALFEQYVRAIT